MNVTKADWQNLLGRLTLDTSMSKLAPVDAGRLDDFEKKRGLALPKSYRLFCEVFGPGTIAECVGIGVPEYIGPSPSFPFSLETLDLAAHEELEYETYSDNPAQHIRAVFFGYDIFRSYHIFDPAEITEPSSNELAVYTLFDAWKVVRIADNFWNFVDDFCLGSKHEVLYGEDSNVDQVFTPVG